MQPAAGGEAQPAHIAGVRRDLGFDEDDVQHPRIVTGTRTICERGIAHGGCYGLTEMSEPKLPTPDELRQKLTEFMKSNLGDQVSVHTMPAPTDTDPEPPSDGAGDIFRFRHQPRDIKAHLDRFVIRQDEAKKVLAIAVCDHYNHIRSVCEAGATPGRELEYVKQNVILIGPTGVGKT